MLLEQRSNQRQQRVRGPPNFPLVNRPMVSTKPRQAESTSHQTASSTIQSLDFRADRRIDRYPRVCAGSARPDRTRERGESALSPRIEQSYPAAISVVPPEASWASMLWLDYRRRRSPPTACRASFSISRTFPWAPAPDASRHRCRA